MSACDVYYYYYFLKSVLVSALVVIQYIVNILFN